MTEKEIVAFDHELGVAVIPGREVALTFPNAAQAKSDNTNSVVDYDDKDNKIAYWGANNDYPQQIIKHSEGTFIPEALDRKIRFLYSIIPTLRWVKVVDIDSKGKEVLQYEKPNTEWSRFIRNAAFRSQYMLESITDFYWFFNVFPEMLLSTDRRNIVGLAAQDASFCRWGLQDEKGKINSCFISADWPDNLNDTTTEIKAIDRYSLKAIEQVKNGGVYKYIYPLSYPTPGKTYYQLAHWQHLTTSGWLEVLKSIPKFKKSLMNNQLSIKYHIAIPNWWWNWKYPGFDGMEPVKRKELYEAEIKSFSDFFSGVESAGNSLMTSFYSNPEMGKEFASWKVEAIDNKIKDGMYIEDSQEASSYMLYCLGLDETLFGKGPGKGMGAGSGSDKRIAFNIYMSTVLAHLDTVLEPLYFIKQYNGWPDDLELRWDIPKIDTLDSGRETSTVSQNGTQANGTS